MNTSSFCHLTQKTLFMVALSMTLGQWATSIINPSYLSKQWLGVELSPRVWGQDRDSCSHTFDESSSLLIFLQWWDRMPKYSFYTLCGWCTIPSCGGSCPRQLFLSISNQDCPLSKAAISHFLREFIKDAHKAFHGHLAPLLKVSAHDVRVVAASLLWSLSKIISNIM